MSNDKQRPNDQRSNVHNPNNPAHRENQDNRSRQLNPRDVRWEQSRSSEKESKNGSK